MGHQGKGTIAKRPPSMMTEVAFISSNLFFLKLYSAPAFDALSFFSVLVPVMIYAIATLFGCLLQFI